MKRSILLFALVLTSAIVLGQFTIGPKVGYNASKLSTSLDTVSSTFKSGFQIGVFVRIGKRFYVQPELYYTTQGSEFKSNKDIWEQKVNIGSLDIPLLVGFKLLNAKVVNLRILAGPMASFVVNRSVKISGIVTEPIENADINSVNWAVQAGAGLDVLFMTLDVRYQIGLNNLIKTIETATINSKNNVWVVSLGFKIL
ncbi:MAG: PorT family protein [Bacteroidetes bacterium]|nr:MAG: PorT family protein [Bacteroidota bacterium]